jgi:hypothetical protein
METALVTGLIFHTQRQMSTEGDGGGNEGGLEICSPVLLILSPLGTCADMPLPFSCSLHPDLKSGLRVSPHLQLTEGWGR